VRTGALPFEKTHPLTTFDTVPERRNDRRFDVHVIALASSSAPAAGFNPQPQKNVAEAQPERPPRCGRAVRWCSKETIGKWQSDAYRRSAHHDRAKHLLTGAFIAVLISKHFRLGLEDTHQSYHLWTTRCVVSLRARGRAPVRICRLNEEAISGAGRRRLRPIVRTGSAAV